MRVKVWKQLIRMMWDWQENVTTNYINILYLNEDDLIMVCYSLSWINNFKIFAIRISVGFNAFYYNWLINQAKLWLQFSIKDVMKNN